RRKSRRATPSQKRGGRLIQYPRYGSRRRSRQRGREGSPDKPILPSGLLALEHNQDQFRVLGGLEGGRPSFLAFLDVAEADFQLIALHLVDAGNEFITSRRRNVQ